MFLPVRQQVYRFRTVVFCSEIQLRSRLVDTEPSKGDKKAGITTGYDISIKTTRRKAGATDSSSNVGLEWKNIASGR